MFPQLSVFVKFTNNIFLFAANLELQINAHKLWEKYYSHNT
jgi:hypothetical protein